MGGLPNILSLFRSEFNKFNNTGALYLSRDIKIRNKSLFCVKNDVLLSFTQFYNGRHYVA